MLPEADAAGAESARTRMLEALKRHRADLEVSAGIGVVGDPATATPEEIMRAAKRDLEARARK